MKMKKFAIVASLLLVMSGLAMAVEVAPTYVPPVHHSKIGDKVSSPDGSVTLTVVGQKQHWGVTPETKDTDVLSPKSAHFHPNGKKYYINSLEGCRTMVYDAKTNKKLAVITHHFDASTDSLWAKPSGLYTFTHYPNKTDVNHFWGRPVESTFSHKGRYLWIPYYRRSFDYNAQDPSAIAVIDTRTDKIIKMMETGPLPKMVATSHNGKYLEVSHWGNNTIGVIDISSSNPDDWHYVKNIVVDYLFPLNYPLDVKVDRDTGSGYMLRGSVFTPDDHYLLVSCMGGTGGIAVVDMQKLEYLGRITGITNARHLVVKNDYLYVSCNSAGLVQRVKLSAVIDAIGKMSNKTSPLSGWEVCKVGGGARTVSLSPSGNFAFVACNVASQLCVVDTRTMTLVASLTLDSYPVGLDMSADGRFAVVTSQGREGNGGNAVNLVQIDYKEAEPTSAIVDEEAEEAAATQQGAESGTNWWLIGFLVAFVVIVAWIVIAKVVRKVNKKQP